jgi:3-oxoacyl-[acyl-carrier-protein] synthase-3
MSPAPRSSSGPPSPDAAARAATSVSPDCAARPMSREALSIVIAGTGAYAPSRVLTNEDLSHMVETSDDWILTRTGIRERRLAAEGETTSDLAARAGAAALADAGVAPGDIDLVVVATATPDMPMPSTATQVQRKLGVPTAACFDLAAACSGFLYGLDTVDALLRTGRYHRALLIGAEKISTLIDWSDRTTCVLFGDGAGAVVLEPRPAPGQGVIDVRLYSDGDACDLLHVPAGGAARPASPATLAAREHTIRMKGREVFKLAVTAMEEAARDTLARHGLAPTDIDLVIPHQANLRIIDSIAERLELPRERFFVNVERYGNTSAASIPIALDEARRAGRIRPGDRVLMVAFGAGLTWASALIRWP